ncbi:hypothetical protein V495_02704, partial [Pseudogymnoascus sp. VKM F-4514 (FW-929)]
NYLAELRDNRIARPGGARPPPTNSRMSLDQSSFKPYSPAAAASSPAVDAPGRAESIISHRRARSSLSTTSRTGRALVQPPAPSNPPLSANVVVPSATYMVRGQRWMEREEMTSLRDALEDMDTNDELEAEIKLHAAAQQEASDLDSPRDLYQEARTSAQLNATAFPAGPPTVRTPTRPSAPANASPSMSRADATLDPGREPNPTARSPTPLDTHHRVAGAAGAKSYGSLAHTIGHAPSRRRSSGKRNISGEFRSSFTTDQIWEEPGASDDEAAKAAAMKGSADAPAPLRVKPRNPLNRVQFEADPAAPRAASTPPLELKPRERFEIYKNPPSQSRNAGAAKPPRTAARSAAMTSARRRPSPCVTAAHCSLRPAPSPTRPGGPSCRLSTTKGRIEIRCHKASPQNRGTERSGWEALWGR